jgi:glycosyltransferase involved in cell wall biosynthesis
VQWWLRNLQLKIPRIGLVTPLLLRFWQNNLPSSVRELYLRQLLDMLIRAIQAIFRPFHHLVLFYGILLCSSLAGSFLPFYSFMDTLEVGNPDFLYLFLWFSLTGPWWIWWFDFEFDQTSMTIWIVSLILSFILLKLRYARLRAAASDMHRRPIIAFFHPHCEQGGGGERVLWSMLYHMTASPKLSAYQFVIITSRCDKSRVTVIKNVKKSFNLDLTGAMSRIRFVYLDRCNWLEAQSYPRLTLLLQGLGSLVTGVEALNAVQPHIFIDTNGYPFMYPLFKYLCGATVMTYTHYPVISANMLNRVSSFKGLYYYWFSSFYSMVGDCVSVILANSSWTSEQLQFVWRNCSGRLHIAFPPCPVQHLLNLPMSPRLPFFISVAQFRPEKDHALQLQAFRLVLDHIADQQREYVRNFQNEIKSNDSTVSSPQVQQVQVAPQTSSSPSSTTSLTSNSSSSTNTTTSATTISSNSSSTSLTSNSSSSTTTVSTSPSASPSSTISKPQDSPLMIVPKLVLIGSFRPRDGPHLLMLKNLAVDLGSFFFLCSVRFSFHSLPLFPISFQALRNTSILNWMFQSTVCGTTSWVKLWVVYTL